MVQDREKKQGESMGSGDPAESGSESPMDRLLDIMRRLRGPGGCPWDREQTLASLKPFLLEECYEELDAIDAGEPDHIREELGDVLLQIVFQAAICEEQGLFDFQDVARTIGEKLIRRHPHVFGDAVAEHADDVVRQWDAIKREEAADRPHEEQSALDGLPAALPALLKADRVQGRAARVGFDWDRTSQVVEKLDEEVAELKAALAQGRAEAIEDEMGDVLFTVVNLSRFVELSAEQALNRTTAKFARRFRAVEQRIRQSGRRISDCTLEELDRVWDAVKADERP